jgi:DNA-binding NarL/FixJ family response regulator
MTAPIRVICVEDHGVLRDGLTLIINLQPDMEMVASTDNGVEGLELFRRHHPDVAIIDLHLPGLSGLNLIKAIRRESPDAKMIVLTMYGGDEDIFKALEAGAITYVLKGIPADDFLTIVRDVHKGGRPVPPEVASALASRVSLPSLTNREIQIVRALSKGLRNKEIAAELSIDEKTVKVHVKHIFEKLQVNDRTAAVTVALERGIIHGRW